ncbi:MAG: thiamine phosphate synthase [Planctomycetota bacterium]
MRTEARIIDAAANRCREGLRTMEDLARFALDHQPLCARLKSLRHRLTAAIAALDLPPGLLTAARDTPGDVGTGVTTREEMDRTDWLGIASAAGARATEAVRTLEEVGKMHGSADFEAIRYELYDVDRELRLALPGLAPQWRLCVLVTESLCAKPWRDVVAGAIAGGADCIQLREKELDGGPLLDRARELIELVDGRAAVIINDRPDIALLAGATGVHLGQTDLPVRAAREIMGAGAIVGVSTANVEQARQAVRDGASVCGIGPMFTSTTKPKNFTAGPAAVRAYLNDDAVSHIPHLAIGGITPDNAAEVVGAGARGLAVSSAVCGSDDPSGVCERLVEIVETTEHKRAPRASEG